MTDDGPRPASDPRRGGDGPDPASYDLPPYEQEWDPSWATNAPSTPPSPPPVAAPDGSTPPPGSPPPAPASSAPSSSRRGCLPIALGVILVGLLGIGGCSYVFWRAVSGPIDAGNEWLAAVQSGDLADAWARSEPSCFPEIGEAGFTEILGSIEIESYRLSSSNVSSNNGATDGSTAGTVTLAGDDERSIEITLVDLDGWKVCGFDIGAAGSG